MDMFLVTEKLWLTDGCLETGVHSDFSPKGRKASPILYSSANPSFVNESPVMEKQTRVFLMIPIIPTYWKTAEQLLEQ